MMISGVDNVIFTTARPARVLQTALRVVQKRWPTLLFAVGENPLRQFRGHFRAGEVPDNAGELCVVRNLPMWEYWDRHGYELMRDGDGPFAVIYGDDLAVDYGLEVAVGTRKKSRGKRASPGLRSARLCCPRLISYDIVTPDKAQNEPFSTWVYEVFCQVCRESEEDSLMTKGTSDMRS